MLSAPGRRWILAATIMVVGLLQAWDSDVLQAGPIPWLLVGAGLVAAAASALVIDPRAAIPAAVGLSGALFLAARWLSETLLPGIFVISVAAGALLLINEIIERREAREAPDEGRAAR